MGDKKLIVEEPVTDYGQLDMDRSYTYLDYLKWQFKERVELIRGRIVKMSPAPGEIHQRVSAELLRCLFNLFHNTSCRVYHAPFDVRLPVPKAGKDTTVVQPDICVICDSKKLDKQGCNGAPDLVVEILSPGNTRHEVQTKFELYEASGVKEYWIVESQVKTVLVYSLRDGKYIGLQPFVEGMEVESPLFPELKLPVEDIFYQVDI
jgi:Uma2 family endonuclease